MGFEAAGEILLEAGAEEAGEVAVAAEAGAAGAGAGGAAAAASATMPAAIAEGQAGLSALAQVGVSYAAPYILALPRCRPRWLPE